MLFKITLHLFGCEKRDLTVLRLVCKQRSGINLFKAELREL